MRSCWYLKELLEWFLLKNYSIQLFNLHLWGILSNLSTKINIPVLKTFVSSRGHRQQWLLQLQTIHAHLLTYSLWQSQMSQWSVHSLLRGNVAKENEGTERFDGYKSWDLLNSFMLLPHLFLKLHMHNLYGNRSHSNIVANVCWKCGFICKVFVFHKIASFSIMDLLAQLVLLWDFWHFALHNAFCHSHWSNI